MDNPVVVVDYDPRWPRRFEEEKARILAAIGRYAVAIEHFGSTAVPGLAAKPIIDVLVGVRKLEEAKPCIEPLEAIGYEYVPEYEAEIPDRRYFRKPRTPPRTHHLGIVAFGGAFWQRHLLFRDYLRAHPDIAKQYAELKWAIAAKYGEDRVAYTNAKTEFIRAIEARARAARAR